MEVVSVCPFRVGSLLFRPAADRWALAVAVKGTFALKPGKSGLAAEQEDLNERENHWDDDPRRSVHAPSDLVPFKPRADVLLVGNAFAPAGKPVRSLMVRMSVGEVDKTIEVYGPRVWTREGELREGARWTKTPLRYERAAGGLDTWNPVGLSADGPPDLYGQRPAPSLQPPGLVLTTRGDIVGPVGFGPIASSWTLRRERLRHRAEAWSDARLADTPLDPDFDPLYFQAAPPDQQVEAIRDEERLLLENLHPEHPRLSTQLSGLHPRAFVESGGRAPQDLALVADTLWIDTDRAIVAVTWRGQVPLDRPDQPGRVVVALEGVGQRLTWASMSALVGLKAHDASVTISTKPAGESAGDVTLGVAHPSEPPRNPLPFAPPSATAPSAAATPTPAAEREARTGPRTTLQVAVPRDMAASLPSWMAQGGGAAAEGAHPPPPQLNAFVLTSAPPREAPVPPPQPPQPSAFAPAPAPPREVPPLPQPPLVSAVLPPAAPPPDLRPPPPLMSAFTATAAAPPEVRPPPPPPQRVSFGEPGDKALAAAGFAGALAASNAAASPASPSRVARAPSEVQEPTAPAQPQVPLELVWFEPSFIGRIRKVPDWGPLLARAPRKPQPVRGAPPPPPEPTDVAEQAARADISSILARGRTVGTADLGDAVMAALGEGGTLTPPLALIAGELEFPFDELELLKATVGAASSLAAADKKLKEVLDLVGEMMKTELRGAPEVVEGLITRVREAWGKANRLLPAGYLETHPERLLLEQRSYQKRDLLDGAWIRALFSLGGAEPPVPTYLPVALAKRLPLFKRFAARAIVEAHPQQDQYERHPMALRVGALARVVTPWARPAPRS
jgi:hypothetical protein